jgi:hypothetical protein|tara:strand:- start:206 stop:364 length:159 start_codon:yes stop_codon:yes gene_type:complete
MDINDAIDRHDLIRLQNHQANNEKDYLTICGLFTKEEQFKRLAERLQKYIDA